MYASKDSPVNEISNVIPNYCKLGNFRENFIFVNSIKKHICKVEISRPRHDLPFSVNNKVTMPSHEGFIFMKLHISLKQFS